MKIILFPINKYYKYERRKHPTDDILESLCALNPKIDNKI